MNVRTSLAALVLCLASTAAMAATAPVAATTAKPAMAAKAKVKTHKHAAVTCKAGESLEKGKCVAEAAKP